MDTIEVFKLSHTEKCLDEITTENKNNGFL